MTIDDARVLDAADRLAPLRKRFILPEGRIYLDGNSLGALPIATARRLSEIVEQQWGADLISSWTRHGWIEAPMRVAAKLAPLLGAEPEELLLTDSTSVSLFKLLAAASGARPGRRTVLTESRNFPTDIYVAEGLCRLAGLELKIVERDELGGAIDGDTAVLMLTHVDYRRAEVHDMAALNRAAHAWGALTLWDLSHSAGALELSLARNDCDLAVGCGYKYLNGGPGAPAFTYVARHLQDELHSPISGWMGHAEPFAFDMRYQPAPGIARFQSGTPSILAIGALETGLDSFAGVDMGAVAAKSGALSQLFIDAVEARCGGELRLASPREASARGSHVSFAHPNGYAVMQALIDHGVVGDFRAPDLIRFGFAPLYNSFEEVWRAAAILGEILERKAWDDPRFTARGKVT